MISEGFIRCCLRKISMAPWAYCQEYNIISVNCFIIFSGTDMSCRWEDWGSEWIIMTNRPDRYYDRTMCYLTNQLTTKFYKLEQYYLLKFQVNILGNNAFIKSAVLSLLLSGNFVSETWE